MTEPLWTLSAMQRAMGADSAGALPDAVTGISIDTRTLAPGDAFFAIKGDARDGHDFVAAALDRGAAVAVVSSERRGNFGPGARLLVVPDVLAGLNDLGRAARARATARIVAITGSVGKTGSKEALRLALSANGETHASAASYNNHWGVPLSLARFPEASRFGVFELGMNHAGEITPLTRLVRPHVALITTVEPVHLEYFGSVEAIADAKAEIFLGVEPGGAAVLNADNPHCDRLRRAAEQAGVARIVTFGAAGEADTRLIDVALEPDGSTVRASILGAEIAYRLGAPGRHIVLNSLGVLTAAVLAGGDLATCAGALAALAPSVGRGARTSLALPSGSATLIDESYNANPASMRAALGLLGTAPTGPRGRRIAVLGDMLELGPEGSALHRDLAAPIAEAAVDVVFCAGPLMRSLWDALPPHRRGAHAPDAETLAPQVLDAVQDGDAVMVKGSLGSRMGPIAKALLARYTAGDAPSRASAQG